jgi:hypothetical protein
MGEQDWATWSAAGAATVICIFIYTRVRRLPVSYLRDYLSDLSWLPAIALALQAWLGVDLVTALIVTSVLAPVGALRGVMFARASGSPPNDPDAVPEDVKSERDALRARLLGQERRSAD